MADANSKRPIIIIKKKGGHGGHHGGAWKVAYADFVTAMMALFIVLWLLSSSTKVKKAVAGYFNDPKSSQKETGDAKTGEDDTFPIDKKSAEKLKEQIEKAIKEQKSLDKLAKQIEITITPEGLRIELIEDKNGTFFQSGSAALSESGQELLGMLAGQLKPLPNRLLLEGHTDAQPYASATGYTNWELSADRANSARRLLQQDGVRKDQVSQVRGYADQLLRVKSDPMDPSNRRISLIVQWAEGAPAMFPSEVSPNKEEFAKQMKAAKQVEAAIAEKPADGKKGEGGKAAEPVKVEAGKTEASKGVPAAAAGRPGDGKATATAPANAPGGKPAAGVPVAKPSLMDKLKGMLPGSKAAKPAETKTSSAAPVAAPAAPGAKPAAGVAAAPVAANVSLMDKLKGMLPGSKAKK